MGTDNKKIKVTRLTKRSKKFQRKKLRKVHVIIDSQRSFFTF